MRHPVFVLLFLALAVMACDPGSMADPAAARAVKVAHLPAGGTDELLWLRQAFETANPGYHLRYHPHLSTRRAADETVVLLVQDGSASLPGTTPALRVGDVIVLRDGEDLVLEGAVSAVEFGVPVPPPAGIPRLIRPDFDPRIADTPGGCADEQDAYRRILLTWLGDNGPYLYHALNCHRVRVQDSFTHYHPVDGGFDELYLVQGVQPGAKLYVSDQLQRIEHPDEVSAAEAAGLLRVIEPRAGDLILLPRGTVHRGVGGILAQIITVPGFVPGAEIGVDHHLRRINERLQLSGAAALPVHAAAADAPRVR